MRRQRWPLLAALQLPCRKVQKRQSQTLWRWTTRPPQAMDTNINKGTPWRSEEPCFPQKGTQPLEEGPSEAMGSVVMEIFPTHLDNGWSNTIQLALLWAGLGLNELHRSSYQVQGKTVTLRNTICCPDCLAGREEVSQHRVTMQGTPKIPFSGARMMMGG